MKKLLITIVIVTFVLGLVKISKAVITIDFDDPSFSEGDEITDQYASLGVTFSHPYDAPLNPIIAQEGAPMYAFLSPSNLRDLPNSGSPISGGNMLTDSAEGHPGILRAIEARFSFPISFVSFYVIDIDASESFTLEAYDDTGTVIAYQTISDSAPGTGDGVATYFEIVASNIAYVIFQVPQLDSRGFAIDDFTFSSCIDPPEISLSVSPDLLWPPNHKMFLITPNINVINNCGCASDVFMSITMNEGDITNTYDPLFDLTENDGDTTDDIQVIDGNIFLRAERAGTGDGRVYTITYTAIDCFNNVASTSATVTVPHNQ